MDSRWLGVIVLIIIVILGGWYIFSRPTTTQAPTTEVPAATSTDMSASTTAPAQAMVPAPVTINYTAQGFSPKTVTITQGQTVTWVNQTSNPMWIASNPHPVHTGYDGTDRTTHCAAGYTGPAPLDECTQAAPGASFSFTFDKAGTWGYHDHLNHTMTGSITVTAGPGTGSKGGDGTTGPNVY